MEERDIIAAISTARGSGAVSMIRLSGKGSGRFSQSFLKNVKENKQNETVDLPHAKMVSCLFCGKINDHIMAVRYDSGKSYTGEESVELYFHGGKKLTELALLSFIEGGARIAEKGEFTRRAFLNGRIDLTQAEGIVDLIDAESENAVKAAFLQSEGRTRKIIEELYGNCVTLLARVEVSIDYPEEDVEEVTRTEAEKGIDELRQKIAREKDGYNASRIVREGARVVLCGKVNAGKSTLFNTLLGAERAIVSNEAGTTRDTIEEKISLRDIAVVLVDTAGERKTDSDAERKGIDRSKREVQSADLTLLVVREGEKKAEEVLAENGGAKDKQLRVVNCFGKVNKQSTEDCIYLNAQSGEGVEKLTEVIYAKCKDWEKGGSAITNARQYDALVSADKALARAQVALKNETVDCVCADLSDALRALGRILGKEPTEDLIGEIFSRFCVGK
ncbi:MAG: tRNA uridine-5-carboxymethylaminomethyl(34) synthesis GTPase MnmE [Clostridiales bacterium]|nr:tRNA uridine-5-carboxymethylaminomethyl(34) synthesis GTPase MnmE [Clostridiales bacterium]